MQNDLFSQGLALMALGMGVVFVFLTLLVMTTYAMSALIQRYFPPELIVEPAVSNPPGGGGQLPDAKTLSIIREAIRQHRNS